MASVTVSAVATLVNYMVVSRNIQLNSKNNACNLSKRHRMAPPKSENDEKVQLQRLLLYNLDLSSQNMQNLSESTTLEAYLDINQLVT